MPAPPQDARHAGTACLGPNFEQFFPACRDCAAVGVADLRQGAVKERHPNVGLLGCGWLIGVHRLGLKLVRAHVSRVGSVTADAGNARIA